MVEREQLVGRLRGGLVEMGLALDDAIVERLVDYLQLLIKWNKAYNLTAVRDPLEMVGRHLLDSLAINPWLRGERVLDVGTGAGLPGIPLAILNPRRQFTLLDSNGKKTRFVLQAASELGLSNVTVEHLRLERYHPAQPFDTITSRAFSALDEFVAGTRHLLAAGGALLAMKGKLLEEERRHPLLSTLSIEVVALQVPFTDGERHLFVIHP